MKIYFYCEKLNKNHLFEVFFIVINVEENILGLFFVQNCRLDQKWMTSFKLYFKLIHVPLVLIIDLNINSKF